MLSRVPLKPFSVFVWLAVHETNKGTRLDTADINTKYTQAFNFTLIT